ncbi:FecR family protein [Pedobacter africanus]|uniref:FecR family protein n=1 Tax=Pedobacter africanus TaxID=151894 RepID=A0A1W2CTJ9_9SPHI|nr:FecR domain-containing protein [Pedobacter africanus]SMC88575.1 FecR family protein [Pedobacter africanus]
MDSINSTFGIGRLIAKHLTNALNAAEEQQLDAWIKADEKHAAIFNRIVVHETLAAALIEMQQINTELALANVKSRLGQQPEQQPAAQTAKLWKRYIGAAAAVAAIAFGIWFFTAPRHLDDRRDNYSNDIAPGSNRATLTMANGNTIHLSQKKSGVIVGDALTYDDGSEILRDALDDKQDNNGSSSRGNEGPITAITPRGGTYSIILQDGTKVWLNADSKLEFLSNYRNKLQRIVKLTGEGYFEVAKDRRRPFIVESNGQQTTVLGTHFNISAYKGEGVKTTLLEGSVHVASLFAAPKAKRATAGPEAGRILKPGQQAVLTASNSITVQTVNVEEAVAWKAGDFEFNDEKMSVIMKKLERWYDVDIVVNEQIADREFTGKISRSRNISRVLDMIEKTTGIKFKIEGRRVIAPDQ